MATVESQVITEQTKVADAIKQLSSLPGGSPEHCEENLIDAIRLRHNGERLVRRIKEVAASRGHPAEVVAGFQSPRIRAVDEETGAFRKAIVRCGGEEVVVTVEA